MFYFILILIFILYLDKRYFLVSLTICQQVWNKILSLISVPLSVHFLILFRANISISHNFPSTSLFCLKTRKCSGHDDTARITAFLTKKDILKVTSLIVFVSRKSRPPNSGCPKVIH